MPIRGYRKRPKPKKLSGLLSTVQHSFKRTL